MYELQVCYQDGSVLYLRGLSVQSLQGALSIFFSGPKHVWLKSAGSDQSAAVQSVFICPIAAPGEDVRG